MYNRIKKVEPSSVSQHISNEMLPAVLSVEQRYENLKHQWKQRYYSNEEFDKMIFEMAKAHALDFAEWYRNGLTNLEYCSKSIEQHYDEFFKHSR